MNAAQAWMKAKMPIAPMADEQSGAMMRRKIRNSEAPSTRAASSSSSGCRGDVLPHQEDAEAHEQVRRRDALIGVDPAERLHREVERDHVGLERQDRGREDQEEQELRPGNWYLPKMEPASSEVAMTIRVATTEMTTLLRKKRTKGAASMTAG